MNAQKIAVITDSCADVPPELAKDLDIYVVPLQLIYSDGTYRDGVDITAQQVYDRLPTEIPKTSLPDGESILRLFEQIKNDGFEKAVAVMLSSGLSGTCNLVRRLGQEYEGLVIETFDTISGSLGSGGIAIKLAEYIRQGRPWEELLSLVPRLIQNTHVFFSVNTLEYLRKGGRIGLISAVTGTMLQIKPVISFAPSGELTSVAKVRGRKASMEKLVELVAEHVQPNLRYITMTAHGNCPEDGKTIKAMMHKHFPKPQAHFESVIDATLGSYVGPHLIGAGIIVLEPDM